MCCVYATQAPTQPGRSTWERRTSATGAAVCEVSLPWGLASRAAHESVCPHGAQARDQALAARSRAVNDAQAMLKKVVETTQAIEGYPELASGMPVGVREQLQEQIADCNRALSVFERAAEGTGSDGVTVAGWSKTFAALAVPSESSATKESSTIFELRQFREQLERVVLHAAERVDE